MIVIKQKDVNRDLIMIFTICYEYGISFTNMLKLFKISKKYFWTFMEICSPMIKMGVRKAACIKKSVDKIYEVFEKGINIKDSNLTPREEKIYEYFSWFLNDCFSDGDGCLHYTQFETIPFAKGYADNGIVIAEDYKSLKNNLDRVSYIKMGESIFYKTSRFLYYMEKYSGDTDIRELNNLSVKEMLKRIWSGQAKQEKEATKLC